MRFISVEINSVLKVLKLDAWCKLLLELASLAGAFTHGSIDCARLNILFYFGTGGLACLFTVRATKDPRPYVARRRFLHKTSRCEIRLFENSALDSKYKIGGELRMLNPR